MSDSEYHEYSGVLADGEEIRNDVTPPSSGGNRFALLFILLVVLAALAGLVSVCLLYTSPSPRDRTRSRMPSSA